MESRRRTKNAGETQIGLVALSTDLTIEQDFHRVFYNLPVKIHTNRIHFDNPITKDNLIKMEGNILDCIGDLFTSGYGMIASVNCSQGGHYLTNNLLRKVFEDKRNFSIIEIQERTLPHTLINRSLLRSIA